MTVQGQPNTFTCPLCGETIHRCEVPGCPEWAIYEGWIRVGMLNQLRKVCETHADLTIARQKDPQAGKDTIPARNMTPVIWKT